MRYQKFMIERRISPDGDPKELLRLLPGMFEDMGKMLRFNVEQGSFNMVDESDIANPQKVPLEDLRNFKVRLDFSHYESYNEMVIALFIVEP